MIRPARAFLLREQSSDAGPLGGVGGVAVRRGGACSGVVGASSTISRGRWQTRAFPFRSGHPHARVEADVDDVDEKFATSTAAVIVRKMPCISG